MTIQLNFFAGVEDYERLTKVKKKRIRYKTPTYTKKYEVLEDESGKRQDERHIFRYRSMYLIYGKLAEFSEISPFDWDRNKPAEHKTVGLLRVFKETYEVKKKPILSFSAEIVGTGKLRFIERLKIHIRLLKLLKQGVELQKACKKSIKYWYKLDM